jgi:hypothetical protein
MVTTECEVRTTERTVRNRPAVALYPVTTLAGSIDPSEVHLSGSLKKHLAGKRFVTHNDVKQAVTSWL